MPRKLTFTEFVEFLLARLYDLDDTRVGGDMLDAHEIAAELERPVPDSWPFDAVQLLQDQGLVIGALAMGPSASAIITGAGRMRVEELARDRESIIHEYRERPANIVIVIGEHHQVAVGNDGDVTQQAHADGDRRQ